jgi:argininosuccinate synthase
MNRDETISYAQERDLPVVTTRKSPYSIDENLWGRSIECGVLEDPWNSPPEDIYELTSSPGDAPEPVDVEIGFDKGIPVSIDGEALGLLNAVEALGKIAGSYGFGRIDMIEDRLVGIKSREVYEAPAALALIAAHQDLENMTLERSVAREKRRLEATWTQLVYEGLWFSPLRTAIDRFIESTSEAVTGDVRVRFAGGSCLPVGRRSPNALYDHGLATYDHEDSFRHSDAEGFIRLWGLPAVQWSKVNSV